MEFKLVRIDYKYCDYLRSFDDKVRYNKGSKLLRPFIGVLFEMNNMEYFAPLASPKQKHKEMPDRIDFIKIDGGKLGAINLNNMIPVLKENYEVINFDEEDTTYAYMLKKQLRWLKRKNVDISKQALMLYNKYINNNLYEGIKIRCCNFPLLEEKCLLYATLKV